MLLNGVFGIANVIVPASGPKAVPTLVDFSNAAEVILDGQAIVSQGKIEYLQGVYIDNSANLNPLTLIMSVTNQRVTCPPQSQGYFSILCPDPPQMTANTTQANIQIPMIFYNVPIQPAVWSAV